MRMVKSFRLSDDEEAFLSKLAQTYNTSEAEVLRKMIYIFAKDALKKEELKEELKEVALQIVEKRTLKEIREQGKRLQRKATFRVRMIRFYSKLMESGVKWHEFKDTFSSWYHECKYLGLDDNVFKDALETIARMYYNKAGDVDLEDGLKEIYQMLVVEVRV